MRSSPGTGAIIATRYGPWASVTSWVELLLEALAESDADEAADEADDPPAAEELARLSAANVALPIRSEPISAPGNKDGTASLKAKR